MLCGIGWLNARSYVDWDCGLGGAYLATICQEYAAVTSSDTVNCAARARRDGFNWGSRLIGPVWWCPIRVVTLRLLHDLLLEVSKLLCNIRGGVKTSTVPLAVTGIPSIVPLNPKVPIVYPSGNLNEPTVTSSWIDISGTVAVMTWSPLWAMIKCSLNVQKVSSALQRRTEG